MVGGIQRSAGPVKSGTNSGSGNDSANVFFHRDPILGIFGLFDTILARPGA